MQRELLSVSVKASLESVDFILLPDGENGLAQASPHAPLSCFTLHPVEDIEEFGGNAKATLSKFVTGRVGIAIRICACVLFLGCCEDCSELAGEIVECLGRLLELGMANELPTCRVVGLLCHANDFAGKVNHSHNCRREAGS